VDFYKSAQKNQKITNKIEKIKKSRTHFFKVFYPSVITWTFLSFLHSRWSVIFNG